MMGLRFPVASFLLLCATGKLVPSGTWFPVSSFGYMMGVQFPVAGFRLLCATGKLALPRSRSEHGHLVVESSTTETAGTWFPVSSFGYIMGYRFSVAGFESRVLGLEGGAL